MTYIKIKPLIWEGDKWRQRAALLDFAHYVVYESGQYGISTKSYESAIGLSDCHTMDGAKTCVENHHREYVLNLLEP